MPVSGKLRAGASAVCGVRRLQARGGPWRTSFSSGSGHIRFNKSAGLGFLFFYSSTALLLRLAGRGGEEVELGSAVDCGIRGGQGRLKLQFGEEHMAAGCCRHDLWSCRWPLQMPLLASVQPPSRRHFHGVTSAFNTPSTPSGLIPGGSGSGRPWSSSRGGRQQGLDCVSFLFSKVLSTKYRGYVVTFTLLGPCMNIFVTAWY